MTIQREPPPSTTPPAILRKPFRWNPGGLQTEFADQPAAFDTLTLTGDLRLNGEIYIDDVQVTPFTPGDTTADYLVGTSQAALSNEIVVGATPGGELGGTWASPTVDATHAGGTHISTAIDFLVGTATGDLSAEIVVGTSPGGELGGTWASPTVDATHSGSAHHTHSGFTDGVLASATAVGATQNVTDATIVNATNMIITPGLASVWAVNLYASFAALTDGGLRFDFSGATACRYNWELIQNTTGVVLAAGQSTTPGTDQTYTAGIVDQAFLRLEGTFTTSTNIQFRFAQDTDTGTNVQLQSESHIFGIRTS